MWNGMNIALKLAVSALFLTSTIAQDASCGAQISAFRSCGSRVIDEYHPSFYEKRKDIKEKVTSCFVDSGCRDPNDVVRNIDIEGFLGGKNNGTNGFVGKNQTRNNGTDGGYANETEVTRRKRNVEMLLMKTDFMECFNEEVISKVIFPEIEGCMRKMIPDYDLPPLRLFFQRKMWKSYGKTMKEERYKRGGGYDDNGKMGKIGELMILSVGMHKALEEFDIEDPAMADKLIWMASRRACNGSDQRDAAKECLVGLAQEYWSNKDGQCKTPITTAFQAMDNFKAFCTDKADCNIELNDTCKEALNYEPKMMCSCAYKLPMTKSIRVGIKDGLARCMHIPSVNQTDPEVNEFLYDMAMYKAETIVQEFCSLAPKNKCKQFFGLMQREPAVQPVVDPIVEPRHFSANQTEPVPEPDTSKSAMDKVEKIIQDRINSMTSPGK